FVKNIDDIISAEEILINAKLKAEESDRLKSAFLANMSHEIRSPMNGILGFANLLRRKDLSEEKKKQFIDIINNNGNQLLVLIDDLLDIAKIEANQLKIEPRNCNLASIINEIYLQYKPKADEKK
ncbi:MAG: histidine kinase dimerization/phospho-acceptor domain-containing protein, partial [Bacteroidales bacterium]|nr:histidine kinase dimerization/phospho-acceptor domain-containing protein [Bacteroidales bacterium]